MVEGVRDVNAKELEALMCLQVMVQLQRVPHDVGQAGQNHSLPLVDARIDPTSPEVPDELVLEGAVGLLLGNEGHIVEGHALRLKICAQVLVGVAPSGPAALHHLVE